MKYLEHVKSIILLLLILLSLTLTLTTWTYSPNYDTNVTPPILDIAIAEKKSLVDVVKPYRLLFSDSDKMTGAISSFDIERVVSSLKSWEIQTVQLEKNRVTYQEINDYIKTPNRFTLFFAAEVPIETYGSILSFVDTNLPNASFNRLVVDWNNPENDEILLYFISTTEQKVYSAIVDKVDKDSLKKRISNQTSKMPVYNEIVREDKLSLYVSNSPENTVSYTYILEEESAPEKFKDALFDNPSLVRSNLVGTSGQEFTDDSSLMNVNFSTKNLNYVHPASESESIGDPVQIIQSGIDFINEHNGWTDDYRYNRINSVRQEVSYQLFFLDLPVFSDDTSTEIIEYWGINRVYRYSRPYYTLDASFPIKTRDKQLPSGQFAYDAITTIPSIDILNIEDIVAGYYLSREDDQSLLYLQPSWYYLLNGTWNRVSPELLGGGTLGLE